MANLHTGSNASSQPITTTTETVVALVPAFQTNAPSGEGVSIDGSVNITTGTGTTAVVIRVRQGASAAGSLVQNALTNSVTAGNTYTLPFDVLDVNNTNADINYVVTVQQTGASANGTVNYAKIDAQSANITE